MHRFPLFLRNAIKVERQSSKKQAWSLDVKCLHQPEVAEAFALSACRHLSAQSLPSVLLVEQSAESEYNLWCSCLMSAMADTLPSKMQTSRRPWTSARTVALIDDRHAARESRNSELV